jgi:lipopolysaccharide export system protein LptA
MPRASAVIAAVLGASTVIAGVVTAGAAIAAPESPSESAPAEVSPAPPAPAPAAASPAPAAPARINTGLVTIESDQQRADQLTGVVTATGNVRIVYPDERVVATARQAQYFSKENRVVLSGDVDIVQEGGNLIRAERVVYLVDSERLTAIPPSGEQVFSRLKIQQQPPAAATAQTQPAGAAATQTPPASPAAQP